MSKVMYSVDTESGILISKDKKLLMERMMREGIRGKIRTSILLSEEELLMNFLKSRREK